MPPPVDDSGPVEGDIARTRTRGLRFALIYLSLCLCILVCSLDVTAISTAAPTIVADLGGESFSWMFAPALLPLSSCISSI